MNTPAPPTILPPDMIGARSRVRWRAAVAVCIAWAVVASSADFVDGSSDVGVLFGGARTAFVLASIATAVALAFGIALGAVSGYYGGAVDWMVTRATEAAVTIPGLLVMLGAAAALGDATPAQLGLVFGLLRWPDVCRVTRAEVRRARQSDYAVAAHALGMSRRRVLFRHVLPDALPQVVIGAPAIAAQALIAEATTAFVGFGATKQRSWGRLIVGLAEGERTAIAATFAITVTVWSLHVIAQAWGEVVDPTVRETFHRE